MTESEDKDVLHTLNLASAPTRPIRKRTWIPWAIGGVVIALLVAGGVVGVMMLRKPVELQTAEVTRGTLQVVVSAVGALEPLHDVTVGSEVSGTVQDVLVETNDTVAVGQVLAVLDRSSQEAQRTQLVAQVAAAEANVRQAQVNADNARIDLDRVEAVGTAGLTARELDQARTTAKATAAAAEAARAQLAAAKGSLATLDANLAKSTLRSPIAGLVLERHVEPGQAVVSALQASPLFRIAEDLERMQVTVEIDEADVARVRPGMKATFTVAAWPGRTFEADVSKVEQAPKTAGSVVTYEAELSVDNHDRALLPGMTATASIVADTQADAMLLPTAALRWSPPDAPPADGLRVWVLEGAAKTPKSVPVERTGSEGDKVAVTSDVLKAGDRVVVGDEADAP